MTSDLETPDLERRHRKHGRKRTEEWLKGLSKHAREALGRHAERALVEQFAYTIAKTEQGLYADTENEQEPTDD